MMSSVEGTFACFHFSSLITSATAAPEIPRRKQHPLHYNRNIQQYRPLPGSDSSNTPLPGKPVITNKVMCGWAGAVLLLKQTEK